MGARAGMALRRANHAQARCLPKGGRTVSRPAAGTEGSMSETTPSLVDFYRQHGISPVRQDISNLEVHFTRRAGLYRQLGLLPGFLRGRSAIEIGPGSGF